MEPFIALFKVMKVFYFIFIFLCWKKKSSQARVLA